MRNEEVVMKIVVWRTTKMAIHQRFASALSFSADGEPCGSNRGETSITSTQVCGDNLRRFYTTCACQEGEGDEVGLVVDDVME